VVSAGAAGADVSAAAALVSAAFTAVRAGALLAVVPARWAEMAATRSPLRMREPPEIPSWLASACSWASFRPARPLLLAGASVNDPEAEDDVSTAGNSSVVSVTKDPSPSTASRLGAGRDDLIWAAVQICSRDVDLAGWNSRQGRILITFNAPQYGSIGLTVQGTESFLWAPDQAKEAAPENTAHYENEAADLSRSGPRRAIKPIIRFCDCTVSWLQGLSTTESLYCITALLHKLQCGISCGAA
jgi:hypothetical protein